jgi:hypothetical protein
LWQQQDAQHQTHLLSTLHCIRPHRQRGSGGAGKRGLQTATTKRGNHRRESSPGRGSKQQGAAHRVHTSTSARASRAVRGGRCIIFDAEKCGGLVVGLLSKRPHHHPPHTA